MPSESQQFVPQKKVSHHDDVQQAAGGKLPVSARGGERPAYSKPPEQAV